MLALAITFAFALYILGPDAFSRFILDFSVPRRAVTLTKSEEVYRAVVWGGTSFLIALLWEKWSGTLNRVWNWQELQTFFSGLYSEAFFRENRGQWFHSVHVVLWMNICLLWRLYVVVLALGLALVILVRYYGRIRHHVSGDHLSARITRAGLAALLLPRIAPWHVLLSRILLPNKHLRIHIDVLTKMDILYQGRFVDKMLAADGTLMNITLARPQRFRRAEYAEAKKRNEETASDPKDRTFSADKFWTPIPTNMFMIMASDIHTMNIRYLPDDVSSIKKSSKAFRDQLEMLRDALATTAEVQRQFPVTLNKKDPDEKDFPTL